MSLVGRTNRVFNPLGDNLVGSTGWTGNRCTIAVNVGFLRMTITDAAAISTGQRIQPASSTTLAARPNEVYRISAQGRTNATVPLIACSITFADPGGAFIPGAMISSAVSVDNTTFTTMEFLLTAPATTAFIVPGFGVGGTGARSIGQTFDIRHVLVEEATSGPYFDGGTAADANFRYAWTGTPEASQSVATANLRRILNQGSMTQSAVRAATI